MSAGGQLDIDEARRIVLDTVSPLGAVAVALDEALGRVLAEDVTAEHALPAFDSSAMDGYAVRAADLEATGAATATGFPPSGATVPATPPLRVVDESRAGRPAKLALEPGQAIAISTGAIVPAGADTVVPVECARRDDGLVHVLDAPAPGAHVRPAGEDVAAGATVLARGATLGPAHLGMLASLGRSRVSCARPPRVSVLATGDELLDADEPARPGAIRESNSHALGALARCAGAHVLAPVRVPDSRERTGAAIARAAQDADALVICGGMSVGEHDHVRPSLAQLGAEQRFWGLALRPGHPTWFGMLHGRPVFGLPGNPASEMVTFVLLAGPALRAMQGSATAGERATALLDGDYDKAAGRAHALRCRLSVHDDGLHARPTGPQRSNLLSSMLHADALAIVPSQATHVASGTRLQIEPLHPWVATFA